MAFSLTFSPYFQQPQPPPPPPPTHLSLNFPPNPTLHFHPFKTPISSFRASRRITHFPQEGGGNKFPDDGDPRNWGRSIASVYDGLDDDGDDDDDDEQEEDRSLDLLVKFVQNVFKKISKRARKAVRSVLPRSISTKLVGFSVNGVLVLAFLWVLKAFLEVVCTLGTAVFVSILLIRGVWYGVSYLQDSRNHKVNEFDDEHQAWTSRAQPAA